MMMIKAKANDFLLQDKDLDVKHQMQDHIFLSKVTNIC